MTKRLLSLICVLALCLTLLPAQALAGATPALLATDVPYLEADGTQNTASLATEVEATTTAWTTGWYVVTGSVTVDDRITVTGDVHLILTDGCSLDASAGITVNGSNSLTIYGQSACTGVLTSTAGDNQAGIGGGDKEACGAVTINGGTITATGGYTGAGIGGGGDGAGGAITINGGTVTATGGYSGAGIGGGWRAGGGTIRITGGTVTASSDFENAADIGDGAYYEGSETDILISGGVVAALGRYGIGRGGGNSPWVNYNGKFSTGEDGNAVIFADRIVNTTSLSGASSEWKGVIFIQQSGTVSGSEITLDADVTIPDGYTLTIPDGNSLTIPAGVAVTNHGTINTSANSSLVNQGILINRGTVPDQISGDGVLINQVGTTVTIQQGAETVDITLKDPEDTVTTDANGSIILPSGAAVATDNGSTITVNDEGAAVTPEGEVTLPAGGSVTVTDKNNNSTTITVPAGGTITPNADGSLGLPGGSTVEKDGEEPIQVPANGGTLNPSTGEVVRNYTVTFDPQNDTTPTTSVVAEGSLVQKPAQDPVWDGHVFDGWHLEKEANNPFPFGAYKISADTTLYGHWKVVESSYLSLTASPSTLTGGGTVTLTVGGLPAGGTATVTCSDSSVTVTGEGATFKATLPNATQTYTFTASYAGDELHEPAAATCTVSVTYQGTSAGGGGSSGGSSSGSHTETTENSDGSTTTTVTESDGTKTETTKYPDGSTTTVTTDPSGKVEVEVKVPEQVVSEAEKNGETVQLPMPPMNAGSDTTITVDLPKDTGTKVEIPVNNVTAGTVVVVVKPDGTEEILMNSTVTERGVTAVLSNGAVVKVLDNTKTFADLPRSHWAYAGIQFAVSRGLFLGTGDNTFSPDQTMTRAMLVTVLARLAGGDTTASGAEWYVPGRNWAMENGLSDGSNMNDPITREQLVTMLYRYVGTPEVSGTLAAYADADSVSDWAADAMNWAVSTGLITGTGEGTLSPTGEATRAQVATILMRFVENMA